MSDRQARVCLRDKARYIVCSHVSCKVVAGLYACDGHKQGALGLFFLKLAPSLSRVSMRI